MSEHDENAEQETEAAANPGADEAQTSDAGESGDAARDRIEELEAENAALRDRALRAIAEADNIRKRAERESASARDYAIERFARDILGVADNLTRALDAIPEDKREEQPESVRNLLAGVEMTQRELLRVFERHNVHAIDPQGESFDPNMHQAVSQIPSDQPAGKVAMVMQTGYRLGERVLRAAMVAVSAGPAKVSAPNGGGEGGAGGNTDLKV